MFREGRLGVDILLVSEEGNTAWGRVVAWGEARSARLHMAAVPRSLHAGSGLKYAVYPGEERIGWGYWWRPCRVGPDDAHIESFAVNSSISFRICVKIHSCPFKVADRKSVV